MTFDQQTSGEKRQSPRFPFIKFIRCDKGSTFGLKEPRPGEIEAAIVNVSKDGVCVLLGELLEPTSVIKVALPVPAVNVTTPTLAEVKWVRKTPWRDSCFAGCRFLI